VAAAAGAVACGSGGHWRALSDAEAKTLAAAADQIVPPDEAPGAAQAGVVEFIDRQLATRERDQLATWQQGLRALDATSRQRHGRGFSELRFPEQTALLEDVESGRVPGALWDRLAPPVFFDRLVRYTMMGFYGDPRHGGNRGHASWLMLGVPPTPIRGRLHETRRDEPG
jgi:gluconate 2-dehydrogenase gamma chain